MATIMPNPPPLRGALLLGWYMHTPHTRSTDVCDVALALKSFCFKLKLAAQGAYIFMGFLTILFTNNS